MRYWLMRRPPSHSTDIHMIVGGSPYDFDKVHPDPRLGSGDTLYLSDAYNELYGWGHATKIVPYQDRELGSEALRVTVVRSVARQNLVRAETIKQVPTLARIYTDSDLNLVELRPHQVNTFNRLIRSQGVDAPADIQDSMNPDVHLSRLAKVYEDAGGSRAKLVELMEALRDEVSSEHEAWDEADYMRDEGWIEVIGDNGPPLVQLTHKAVKAVEQHVRSKEEATGQLAKQEEAVTEMRDTPSEKSLIDVFISHSSRDRDVAAALIDLLRAALNIPAEKIRCTSVDGYRLPAGASTDEQLRREIYEARAFIGLITPTSLQSTYVLFELGARWGARRHLAPALASGTETSAIRQPLASLNALSCDVPAQVYQLVSDIASSLGVSSSNPSAYQKYVDALIGQSRVGSESYQNQGKATVAGAEVSIFSTIEESDFSYVYKKLDRNLEVDFTIYQKEGEKPAVKVGRDIYTVNLLGALFHYIDKGYRHFDYSYFDSVLLIASQAQPSVKGMLDAAQSYYDCSAEESLGLELHTYGLTRPARRQRGDRTEDSADFTEKLFRFRYWLDYNNRTVKNISFDFVRHDES